MATILSLDIIKITVHTFGHNKTKENIFNKVLDGKYLVFAGYIVSG